MLALDYISMFPQTSKEAHFAGSHLIEFPINHFGKIMLRIIRHRQKKGGSISNNCVTERYNDLYILQH